MSARRSADAPPLNQTLTNARTAVAVCLFVAGALLSTWMSRIPVVKHHLDLSTTRLSIALVGVPAGLLVAMRLVPPLVARRSSRFVVRAAIILAAVSIASLGLTWNLASLTGSLIVFGVAGGALDVAVNVQATAVERDYGRPVMSRLHAMYSTGILIGALAGSVTLGIGLSSPAFFAIMATLLATVGLLFTRQLLGDAADAVIGSAARDHREQTEMRLVRQPRLLAAGIIAFSGLFVEGAVNDWAGVFLHQVRGTSFSVAALGTAAFGIGMALGRLGGDALIEHAGRRTILTTAALLAAVAISVAVLIPASAASIAAFAAVGLTLATIVPSAFSLAGGIEGLSPTWTISRVTTIGYLGTFSSPAAVGLLAGATGLTAAMLLPAILLVLVWPASLVSARWS